MHLEQRRAVSMSLKVVVIGYALAGQLLFAGPGGKAEEAAPEPGPASVAVIPFVLDGRIDEELHSEMTEASGWTSQRAKREAGKTASKTLLKDLGRD